MTQGLPWYLVRRGLAPGGRTRRAGYLQTSSSSRAAPRPLEAGSGVRRQASGRKARHAPCPCAYTSLVTSRSRLQLQLRAKFLLAATPWWQRVDFAGGREQRVGVSQGWRRARWHVERDSTASARAGCHKPAKAGAMCAAGACHPNLHKNLSCMINACICKVHAFPFQANRLMHLPLARRVASEGSPYGRGGGGRGGGSRGRARGREPGHDGPATSRSFLFLLLRVIAIACHQVY